MLPVVLFVIGVGAGGFGALLGVGGGALLVPALVLVTHVSFPVAVGTSLVCVVATSVAGSAVRFSHHAVDVRVAVRLQTFAVVGAVAGALVAPAVPVAALHVAFGLFLLLTAWSIWPRTTAISWSRHPSGLLAGGGAAVGGGVASLLGVGGGIVFTPVLHLLVGLDFHKAAATSVFLIGITAGSGALIYLARGTVELPLVGPTLLGMLLGAMSASTVAHRVSARWLKRTFAVLLAYVAVRMLLEGHGGA